MTQLSPGCVLVNFHDERSINEPSYVVGLLQLGTGLSFGVFVRHDMQPSQQGFLWRSAMDRSHALLTVVDYEWGRSLLLELYVTSEMPTMVS